MRKVESLMGMPIAIEIQSDKKYDKLFTDVFNEFRRIENNFSFFKKDSELSLFNAEKIKEDEISAELKFIKNLCQHYKKRTNGYFDAYFDDLFNPTGLVKAWAIKSASLILDSAKISNYFINAGGDILVKSVKNQHQWDIGIQDPKNKNKIIANIKANNLAVATSGSYIRGKHIVDPFKSESIFNLNSVSVLGPEIITADVFATAIFAMGLTKGKRFITSQNDYEAIFVDLNAKISTSFKQ